MMNNVDLQTIMPSSRVAILTREDITATAKTFQFGRQMPKWTVVIDGRELPARPLVLRAAGVFPNDPTNSHQAIAILQGHGFEVRYQGNPIPQEDRKEAAKPSVDEIIRNLQGLFKGEPSMLEDWEREHRIEKDRL
ncbi:MAG TPA: hypothetical protein VK812_19255 [Candidatus Binatus sp.]|nr:hypothetical protein [Candidatus Binatus sp.]